MQITPKDAPASAASPTPQVDARSRAIAMLERATQAAQAPNAQEMPVANPSLVAPEEMTAISSTSTSEPAKASEQTDNSGEVKPAEAKDGEEPISDKFAQLARKEKAMRAKMLEMKAQDDSIRAREAAIAAKEAKEASAREELSLKDRLAKDPLSVLNEMGLSYDKLTEMVLNREMPKAEDQAIAKLTAEIEAIKKGQESAQKAQVEAQQRQYEQAINSLRNDTKRLVESDPEFETVKVTDSVEDVVQLIEKTFNEEGKLLTVEEAARAVEDYLLEEATKLARIKKVQQRLAPSSASPQATAPAKSQGSSDQKSTGTKTLTNAISTPRQLSAKERAMLAFKGELK